MEEKQKTQGIWELYYCPICDTFQESGEKCEYCRNKKIIRKEIKDGAEYCRLIRKHANKQVGRTVVYKGRGRWPFEKHSCYQVTSVFRCRRCNKKSIDQYTGYYSAQPDGSWGEQPD